MDIHRAVSAAAVFDLGNATGAAKDVTAADRQARISDGGKGALWTASARRLGGFRFGDQMGRQVEGGESCIHLVVFGFIFSHIIRCIAGVASLSAAPGCRVASCGF